MCVPAMRYAAIGRLSRLVLFVPAATLLSVLVVQCSNHQCTSQLILAGHNCHVDCFSVPGGF